jgi:hypothetical protein
MERGFFGLLPRAAKLACGKNYDKNEEKETFHGNCNFYTNDLIFSKMVAPFKKIIEILFLLNKNTILVPKPYKNVEY